MPRRESCYVETAEEYRNEKMKEGLVTQEVVGTNEQRAQRKVAGVLTRHSKDLPNSLLTIKCNLENRVGMNKRLVEEEKTQILYK